MGHWYVGEIVDIFLLTSSTGTLNPAAPATPKMPFVMSVPSAPAGANGYAVSLFGHGFTRDRNDGFGMSSALAQAGNVMVAIDEPWHGERNTCVGFGAYLAQAGVPAAIAQDLYACVNPAPPTAPTATCNATTGALPVDQPDRRRRLHLRRAECGPDLPSRWAGPLRAGWAMRERQLRHHVHACRRGQHSHLGMEAH